MRRTIKYCLLATAALLSGCSSDSETNGSRPEDIVGTWDAVALSYDENSANDDMDFASDILDHLTEKECYILTFRFNEDLSVIAMNSLNYLEVNVNQAGTGLDIPCPVEKDTDFSTYTFDGETLTYLDDDAMPVEVKAKVSKGSLYLDATDLDIPNLNSGGQLVFRKR